MCNLLCLLLLIATPSQDIQFESIKNYTWQMDGKPGFVANAIIHKKDLPTRFSIQLFNSIPGWTPIRIDCLPTPPVLGDENFNTLRSITFERDYISKFNQVIAQHYSLVDPPSQIQFVVWFHALDQPFFTCGKTPTLEELNGSVIFRFTPFYETQEVLKFKKFIQKVEQMRGIYRLPKYTQCPSNGGCLYGVEYENINVKLDICYVKPQTIYVEKCRISQSVISHIEYLKKKYHITINVKEVTYDK